MKIISFFLWSLNMVQLLFWNGVTDVHSLNVHVHLHGFLVASSCTDSTQGLVHIMHSKQSSSACLHGDDNWVITSVFDWLAFPRIVVSRRDKKSLTHLQDFLPGSTRQFTLYCCLSQLVTKRCENIWRVINNHIIWTRPKNVGHLGYCSFIYAVRAGEHSWHHSLTLCFCFLPRPCDEHHAEVKADGYVNNLAEAVDVILKQLHK